MCVTPVKVRAGCMSTTINDAWQCFYQYCLNLVVISVKELDMPIDVRKVPSKARKVAVEIVPAEWQDYLLH